MKGVRALVSTPSLARKSLQVMRAEDVTPALAREVLHVMRAESFSSLLHVDKHHVAGGRIFPGDSSSNGRSLRIDVVGKQ